LLDCWLTYQCYGRMNFSPTEQSLVEEDIRINVQTIPEES
jgi:hypothetical protein